MATTADTSVFIYKGKNRKGEKVEGELRSDNLAGAKSQLRKQGIISTSIKKKAKPLFSRDKKIVPADIAAFTRQLATMMKAGLPLVQSFEIVADGVDKPLMRDLIYEIRDNVSAGGGFAAALRRHPRQFDDLFCSLVGSGETAGALETMLDRVATYKEKTEQLKAKIKKALTYPIAVMVIALVVTAILLIKVVPIFAETFSGFGADLPAFTLFVLGLSDAIRESWVFLLFCIGAGLIAFREARFRSEKFAYGVDRAILKIPIVGLIVYNSIIARFARTLSTTFSAGVPIVDALESVAGAAGNRLYADAIIKISEEVMTGIQLQQAIKNRNMFPMLLQQMAAIGEESGALDEMLEKAATHYEEAVDNSVDNLTSLLEPMIMSVLGVLVGGLLIAMYLPIFQLGNVV
ncbi:MAG: type II secretion system F family protein [Porticoccaceae bacterium]|nr:type II secretion system F family protein [Porticoccaceae bacterium]